MSQACILAQPISPLPLSRAAGPASPTSTNRYACLFFFFSLTAMWAQDVSTDTFFFLPSSPRADKAGDHPAIPAINRVIKTPIPFLLSSYK